MTSSASEPSLPFRLYNTLTRQVEPIAGKETPGSEVGMYVCGPTVYNYAHIGNLRTYVSVDLVRRALRFFGHPVRHVMNITDVDDKTIRDSQAEGVPLGEFTSRYRRAFLEDLAALRIELPDEMPAATDFIGEMIRLIQRLEEKGAAYRSDDGTVYFRLEAFPEYGKLSHLDREHLRSGARVSQDEYQKEGIGDFALWKAWSEADGDVGWDSPWGRGRPGWHLECSAMSMKFLGETFDLHAGGEDLCFPHHENEIAQSEAASGQPFVRHWMHGAHLMVEGKKMSKSEGNLFTVNDIQKQGFSGRELRVALMAAHYRQNLNFTWKGMEDAQKRLKRIEAWRNRLEEQDLEAPLDGEASCFVGQFRRAIGDDLNLPQAWAHVDDYIRQTNRRLDAGEKLSHALAAWLQVNEVLGLQLEVHGAAMAGVGDEIEIEAAFPPEIQQLLDDRAAARQAKDFAQSDSIRDQLKDLGWVVKDTPQGQELAKT